MPHHISEVAAKTAIRMFWMIAIAAETIAAVTTASIARIATMTATATETLHRAAQLRERLRRCWATRTIFTAVAVVMTATDASTTHAQLADWAKEAGQHRSETRTITTSAGGTIQAEEGWIAVPERRSSDSSRLIELHYLRLRSPSAESQAPLVYLAGGPGSPAVPEELSNVDHWVPFLGIGDVVLLDQRGTRDEDLRWMWDGPLPLDFFLNAETARAHLVELSRRASEAIRARGVDVAGYTTAESAEDLESLRVALGTPAISLLGFSYGTHLACAYLREHGDRVENAILIGTEGPDMTYKLPASADAQWARISARAAADPRLRERIPDLTQLLDRVEEKLARQPMLVTIPTPDGGEVTLPIGPFGLRFILRADLGDASDIPVFPRLLWSIDQGDPSLLSWFIAKRGPIAIFASGMSYAMDSASGWSAARRQAIESQSGSRFAEVVNFPYPDIVEAWGLPDLGDAYRAPLISSARTLFLSGELDWNTPPYQAEEIKWGFSNATHLIVADAGHEQIWTDETTPILIDFLKGENVRDRRLEYRPLRFLPLEGIDPEMSHPAVRS